MRIFFMLVPVFVTASAAAASSAGPSLIRPYPQEILKNEVVVFAPIEGHHVNSDAPASCGDQAQIAVSKKGLTCQFASPGMTEVRLSICDDAKTFCREERVTAGSNKGLGLSGWVKTQVERILPKKSYPGFTNKTPNRAARGFIHNDIAGARKLARESGKPLLIYFTQLYCPPCQMLKEYSLETDRFQELTKDVVKVQIDADTDSTAAMVQEFEDIKTTPTLVLLDSNQKRIGVSRDLLSADTLGEWIKDRLQNPSAEKLESIEDYRSRNKVSDIVKGLPKAKECMTNRLFWPVSRQKLSASDVKLLRSLAERQIAAARAHGLKLECLIETAYLYNVLAYVYEQAGNKKERAKFFELSSSAYLRMNEIPGSRPHSAVKLFQAMAEESESDKYQELAQENPGDFSFDYLQAASFHWDKKFEKALAATDRALAKATDRNWLKVIAMKVELLYDMGRPQDSRKLIEQTLAQVHLPADPKARIHEWVQQLRGVESKIRAGVPAKTDW